jgi:hypothetical protein
MLRQLDEKIPYEQFASQMRKFNDEQHLIVDDILYKKNKNPMQPLYIFLTWGIGTRKTFTLMCIIQYMLSYYIKQFVNLNPLKPKI